MAAKLRKKRGAVYLGTVYIEYVLVKLFIASVCVLITLAVLASRGKIGGGKIAIALCSVLAVVALSIGIVLGWHRDVTSNKLNDLLSLSNEEIKERKTSNSGVVAILVGAAIGTSLVIVAILAGEGKIKGGVPVVISCVILSFLIPSIICLVVSIFTSGACYAFDIMGPDNGQTNRGESERPPPYYGNAFLPEDNEGGWATSPSSTLGTSGASSQGAARYSGNAVPLPTYKEDSERFYRGGGPTMEEVN